MTLGSLEGWGRLGKPAKSKPESAFSRQLGEEPDSTSVASAEATGYLRTVADLLPSKDEFASGLRQMSCPPRVQASSLQDPVWSAHERLLSPRILHYRSRGYMKKPPRCLTLQGFQANETPSNGGYPDGKQEPYTLSALRARHLGPASPAQRGCHPDRRRGTRGAARSLVGDTPIFPLWGHPVLRT